VEEQPAWNGRNQSELRPSARITSDHAHPTPGGSLISTPRPHRLRAGRYRQRRSRPPPGPQGAVGKRLKLGRPDDKAPWLSSGRCGRRSLPPVGDRSLRHLYPVLQRAQHRSGSWCAPPRPLASRADSAIRVAIDKDQPVSSDHGIPGGAMPSPCRASSHFACPLRGCALALAMAGSSHSS
jgi:hypothetical protein